MTTFLIIITFISLMWVGLAIELANTPTVNKDLDTDYLPFED